jgi:hypothetical protein
MHHAEPRIIIMTKHSQIRLAASTIIALVLVGCGEDPSSRPIAVQPAGSQAPTPGAAPATLPDGQPAPASDPHRPIPGK